MSFSDNFIKKELIYSNKLEKERDISEFRLEGEAIITFGNSRMRMENKLDPQLGQASNYVFWCPFYFPDCVLYEWDFYPISEPGLAMFFFSAAGKNGADIFNPSLEKRDGQYKKYHSGDINAFHASYFRRKAETERAFQTCNLRKSYGFHLVSQGADPLPSVIDAIPPYKISVIKYENEVIFSINDLTLYRFFDDGKTYGNLLTGGKIGFRQMAPLIAEYSNFNAYSIRKER